MRQGPLDVPRRDAAEAARSLPDDKYLPSYLVRGQAGEVVFHAVIATDIADRNVRIVTMYAPDRSEWSEDFRVRRTKQ